MFYIIIVCTLAITLAAGFFLAIILSKRIEKNDS